MSRFTLADVSRPLATLRSIAPLERASAGPRLLADGGSDREDDHLRDVPDGAGCTEIWEHLSERATADADD